MKLLFLIAIFPVFLSSSAFGADNYTPVNTLGVPTLPFQKDENGIKVFKLVAEEVRTKFCDLPRCKTVITWGFNGSTPGPTIEAVEGDTVRIEFKNRLNMPTAVHWHGLELPNAMDGGGMHTQRLVRPGESFVYQFKLEQHGTYMYHSGHMQALQAQWRSLKGF